MASPNQLFGRAEIYVNGSRIDSMPGAKITPGGVKRAAVVGDVGVLGFSEATEPPMIECEVALRRGQTLKSKDFDDATVVFVCDTGQRFVIEGAFVTDALNASGGEGGGKVPLKISGISSSERT